MARAEYTDQIVNSEGHPVRGVVLKPETNVKVHAGSAGEEVFWAGETGPGTVSSVKSDAQGFVQVWLTEGRYDISIPKFKIAKTIELINQSRVATGGGISEAEAKALVKTGPYASAVVKSTTVPLGSVSGSVTPNMAEGDVFKGKSTAEVKLQTPSNWPSEGSKRRYIEVEIEGKFTIASPFIAGWRFGVEPPQDLSSPTSKNGFTFYSDDGVTWYGVGSEGLPSDVIRASVGSVGQALISDGEKYNPATIPSGGLSEAEVRAIFEAEVAEEFFSLLLENGGAAALKPHLPALTTSTTLTEDNFYLAAKAAITLTLPVEAVLQQSGRVVAIRNESGGTIKVKGKLNTAVPAEITTEEVKGAETILYTATGGGPEENVWLQLSQGRTLAAVESLITTMAPVSGATTPEEPAEEGAISQGVSGVSHRIVFAIKGDGAKTVWKLKHELNTKAITVSIQTSGSKKPKEQELSLATLLGASGKIDAKTVNEVEVTFTTAPAAKLVYFVSVAG
jgi:hypothetical protein